jgi:hypothetical protein
VTFFRCLDDSRGGRWKGKPTAANTLIAIEVTVTWDQLDEWLQ